MTNRADPRVTVVVTTYNDERFIRATVDGVLMQHTDFPFKVVIIDDCSTDRTREIVLEYQRVHPAQIHLVLEASNQGDNRAFMEAIQAAPGPYVAPLDGDDYWTSRDKLQRQVEFLDRHPECSMCFHAVDIIHEDGSTTSTRSFPPGRRNFYELADLIDGCFIHTCSTMFRKAALGRLPDWYVRDHSADWSLFVLAALNGQIGYLDETMAVYRKHAAGYWSGLGKLKQHQRILEFYQNLLSFLPDALTPNINAHLAYHSLELARTQAREERPEFARRWLQQYLTAEPSLDKLIWSLRADGDNAAALVWTGGALRAEIERAVTDTTYDIQLNQTGLCIESEAGYSLSFRARADQPRELVAGVAQAHEPWSGLGLYARLGLGTDWKAFAQQFVATSGDANARIHFDLGGHSASVELEAIELRRLPGGQAVRPALVDLLEASGRGVFPGYQHPHYAGSLAHLGTPVPLLESGGWILHRGIPGSTARDAMGCYPLFACRDWTRIEEDLSRLDESLVSLVVVTDPFGEYDLPLLQRAFPDLARPYKEHFVVDLGGPLDSAVSSHHRRCARRALRHVTVERVTDPFTMAEEWAEMYERFIVRHQMVGPAAFPKTSLVRQLAVPGLVMYRGLHQDTVVGIHLWYVQGDIGYAHLAAYNDLGYQLGASYALFWSEFQDFSAAGLKWLLLGGAAGGGGGPDDGLTLFKRGWSTGTRWTYLCGRIFDQARYDSLAAAKGTAGSSYFPAYREGEFAGAGRTRRESL